MRLFLSFLRKAVIPALVLAGALVLAALGFLALWYQFPASGGLRLLAAIVWVGFTGWAAFALLTHRRRLLLAYAVAFAALVFWWVTIPASNHRLWADDVAMMMTGSVDASRPNIVTLTNVRNFDWRTTTDYTPRWETRSYDLDHLVSTDLVLSYWSGPAIAHTLVSFGFENGDFVTFSVEIRKEKNESFSEIGGFFKEFETSVVAADERDIVRLRSNVRGEDVYLYRIGLSREAMRSLFLAYVEEANLLAEKPRFYNTITANCTTIVYDMVARIVTGLPLDYRLLFSGYLPEYIHDVGGLERGYSLEQLRSLGRVRDRAVAADRDPDFSRAIRAGMPGVR